jgi:hypothetical protein
MVMILSIIKNYVFKCAKEIKIYKNNYKIVVNRTKNNLLNFKIKLIIWLTNMFKEKNKNKILIVTIKLKRSCKA